MNKPKVIAFYLPQYHPTTDNDKWWGKGFTEWTNVGKARPLFKGHYQPKVPADLGYYDLRLPEVRETQAELAKEAGIYGFCYYHYWFGNGKEELELPFNEVLKSGKPDFPFMLCWANESWHKKFWNKDGKGSSKEVLVEQTYPGEKDIIDHFYRLLPAFKDSRYIRIDGKPAFMIYKPYELRDTNNFINIWNDLAKKEGLNGIHFVACLWQDVNTCNIVDLLNNGFNAVNKIGIWEAKANIPLLHKVKRVAFSRLFNIPVIDDYQKITDNMFNEIDQQERVYPTILPNWDHTPRSGKNGVVFKNSTPENFKKQCIKILDKRKNNKDNIIFLKSWNEWGEGNYMEPDLKYGHGYINALREALDQYNK